MFLGGCEENEEEGGLGDNDSGKKLSHFINDWNFLRWHQKLVNEFRKIAKIL